MERTCTYLCCCFSGGSNLRLSFLLDHSFNSHRLTRINQMKRRQNTHGTDSHLMNSFQRRQGARRGSPVFPVDKIVIGISNDFHRVGSRIHILLRQDNIIFLCPYSNGFRLTFFVLPDLLICIRTTPRFRHSIASLQSQIISNFFLPSFLEAFDKILEASEAGDVLFGNGTSK
jgi:hypothetical protein